MKKCIILDPYVRPASIELVNHQWLRRGRDEYLKQFTGEVLQQIHTYLTFDSIQRSIYKYLIINFEYSLGKATPGSGLQRPFVL